MSEQPAGENASNQDVIPPLTADGRTSPGSEKTAARPRDVIRPGSDFMRRIEKESGVKAASCYGCKKCSNGCPMTFAMDLHPYQVVRLVQLGQTEKLKNCRTIWICAACHTCVTRCPNDVDLPLLMDVLKDLVTREGVPVEERRIKLFHQLFLKEVRARGRVFEGGLMARYLFKSRGFLGREALDNARLGWAMFVRGRMKLLPRGTSDRGWLKSLFSRGGGK